MEEGEGYFKELGVRGSGLENKKREREEQTRVRGRGRKWIGLSKN